MVLHLRLSFRACALSILWDVEFRPQRGVYFNDLPQSIFVSTQYFSNIIYSYKYLESDLIKHCHVIFIHSFWSTAREEIPRKFPREPRMFLIIVASLDSTDNTHGVQRQVRRCRRRRNFIYYIEYFRKAAGILLLGSNGKIFDIIYQLSPLLECDPTVCLPSKSQVTLG